MIHSISQLNLKKYHNKMISRQNVTCMKHFISDTYMRTGTRTKAPSNGFITFLKNLGLSCCGIFTSFLEPLSLDRMYNNKSLNLNRKGLKETKKSSTPVSNHRSQMEEPKETKKSSTPVANHRSQMEEPKETKKSSTQVSNHSSRMEEPKETKKSSTPVSNHGPRMEEPKEEHASNFRKIDVVKAKTIEFIAPLSNNPIDFIDEIWKEFEEVFKNASGTDGLKKIREFLNQPKVLNRLAANRNPKMKEFIQNYNKSWIDSFIKSTSKGVSYDTLFSSIKERHGLSDKVKMEFEECSSDSTYGFYTYSTKTVVINKLLKEKNNRTEIINTIFHELTHAKQYALLEKYFDFNDSINSVKSNADISSIDKAEDKIMFLSTLLSQLQYDYTFTNGCDPTSTIQLCHYEELNHEVEAFAVGDYAAGQF